MGHEQLKRADDLHVWAYEFLQENNNSIDYFLKYGSPIEKALMTKVMQLAVEVPK
ncbi:hypothetical protein V7O66_02040 [Methanolobus sp. ZRKC3]|uniref:hypothetical protein n=1 Tax=Methanolobus sp. ZRKC3 TaxID=3125786 RepID=UPI00324B286A